MNSQSEVTDCLYGTLVPHSATNADQLLKALRRIPKHRTESRVYFLQNVPQRYSFFGSFSFNSFLIIFFRFRAEIAPEAVQALVEVLVQRYFLNQAHMCKTTLYTLHFYLTDKYTGLCKVSEARLCATLITGHNQYYGMSGTSKSSLLPNNLVIQAVTFFFAKRVRWTTQLKVLFAQHVPINVTRGMTWSTKKIRTLTVTVLQLKPRAINVDALPR